MWAMAILHCVNNHTEKYSIIHCSPFLPLESCLLLQTCTLTVYAFLSVMLQYKWWMTCCNTLLTSYKALPSCRDIDVPGAGGTDNESCAYGIKSKNTVLIWSYFHSISISFLSVRFRE